MKNNYMVPQGRIELPAYSLPMNYSTPELLRQYVINSINNYINHLYNNNCIHLMQERHPNEHKEF